MGGTTDLFGWWGVGQFNKIISQMGREVNQNPLSRRWWVFFQPFVWRVRALRGCLHTCSLIHGPSIFFFFFASFHLAYLLNTMHYLPAFYSEIFFWHILWFVYLLKYCLVTFYLTKFFYFHILLEYFIDISFSYFFGPKILCTILMLHQTHI